jgi:hypothetical protein
MRRTTLLTTLVILIAATARAEEIPAFARRYRASCSLCHTVAPRLSAFGEAFAGNGFRMAPDELPRDTISTGDELLDLYRDLPLAIRLDGYVTGYLNGSNRVDLQTPYNAKILAGGAISRKLSYYLYFFLFERGEVGGIEDAFVYVNDIGGKPVDLAAGQFQVSDPMFKRELRLEYEDYAVYRARIGLQPTDLTYDRGFMGIADVAGFTITGEVLNGNGRVDAGSDRQFDNDLFKNVFGEHRVDGRRRCHALGWRRRNQPAVHPPTGRHTDLRRGRTTGGDQRRTRRVDRASGRGALVRPGALQPG